MADAAPGRGRGRGGDALPVVAAGAGGLRPGRGRGRGGGDALAVVAAGEGGLLPGRVRGRGGGDGGHFVDIDEEEEELVALVGGAYGAAMGAVGAGGGDRGVVHGQDVILPVPGVPAQHQQIGQRDEGAAVDAEELLLLADGQVGHGMEAPGNQIAVDGPLLIADGAQAGRGRGRAPPMARAVVIPQIDYLKVPNDNHIVDHVKVKRIRVPMRFRTENDLLNYKIEQLLSGYTELEKMLQLNRCLEKVPTKSTQKDLKKLWRQFNDKLLGVEHARNQIIAAGGTAPSIPSELLLAVKDLRG